MSAPVIYFWKRSPLVRLLLPFIAGILIQWYARVPMGIWFWASCCSLAVMLSFFLLPVFRRYKSAGINGLAVSFLFMATGALLTWQKDTRHTKQWFGHSYSDSTALVVTLEEPVVEKTRSLKAEASVSCIIRGDSVIPAQGKIIVYFQKEPDSSGPNQSHSLPQLRYGSQIIFKKPVQEIKNSGNPGGFDYKRYAFFHGITHQVYLKQGEFELSGSTKQKPLTSFIYTVRERILAILRTHIPGDKEAGLAEALLIGYKDDLDKSLVQSYSNTGVVHIIAISGLHLGLIYWLLVKLFQPIRKRKGLKWLPPLLIIAGLWAFSLLAGAQPSVLRSALMFTCIVAGESIARKTNIYNSLALSAFILLCYNPYWLWDVGFQLSYAAVLSIVLFMRPIYNLLYFENKLVDMIWKLNAVTLAAQVLTLPLSIYYFHQFPNYFLFTNLVAVPLSSLILLGEIFLCLIAFIPAMAALAGKLLAFLIGVMNRYIEKIESLPFSLWDGLQLSVSQTILLFIFIAGSSYWLMEQSKTGLKTGLIALLAFATLRSYAYIQTGQQQKIIVYNVSRQRAVDLINGHDYFFAGNAALEEDDFARNFHLKPARVLYRTHPSSAIDPFHISGNYITCKDKHILLVDEPLSFPATGRQPTIDLLVLSKNPRIYMNQLAASLSIKQVVIDGSVPAWKARYWKRDCDSLHIPCHDVTIQGAFVMNLR
jgi:competence protein ComEC